jgi:hypothetical protein
VVATEVLSDDLDPLPQHLHTVVILLPEDLAVLCAFLLEAHVGAFDAVALEALELILLYFVHHLLLLEAPVNDVLYIATLTLER